ncbi:MAG: glycoside hydrolase family 16 protein, partial [Xanthomonadales bacterium]
VLWSDEFDAGSRPDPATWSYDLGAGGWGNRELQAYTDRPANVRVEDGHLVITARANPDTDSNARFTSARITTRDKLVFRYGTVEARIRVPDLGAGLWPAFWTLGNDFGEVGWPRCGEIDVMEMGHSDAIDAGLVNRRVGSAAHWDTQGAKGGDAAWRDAAVDLDDGFHVYRMDWTPTRITTYLDEEVIGSFRIDAEACTDCSEFQRPHFLLLNLAVGGNYTGRLAPGAITAPLPAELRVDYVRILDNGFTELGGASVSTGSKARVSRRPAASNAR